jgi:hypothetical protein
MPPKQVLRRTARRIDLPCKGIGMVAPAMPLHLKVMPAQGHWAIAMLVPSGQTDAAARWLARQVRAKIYDPLSRTARLLRAEADTLPPLWHLLFAKSGVERVDLSPSGTAALFLTASNSEVSAFVQALGPLTPPAHARLDLSRPARLTNRQLEVLSAAIAMGYYDIPHGIDLRMLSEKLGTSLGTTAEVLRRAEAVVLQSHVDRLSAQVWSEASPSPELKYVL